MISITQFLLPTILEKVGYDDSAFTQFAPNKSFSLKLGKLLFFIQRESL